MESLQIAHTILHILEDKKGENILLLDIQPIAVFADYFVICSGTSGRMLQALAEAAVNEVKQEFHFRGRKEGEAKDGWLVVDFGDVVLHLFSPDQRKFYQLEELWSQGKVLLRVQ